MARVLQMREGAGLLANHQKIARIFSRAHSTGDFSMSAIGVSPAPSYQTQSAQQYGPPQNGQQQNFQSLMQAIQSGNLSAAQQAYATLTANMPQGQAGQSANEQGNPMQQAMASI